MANVAQRKEYVGNAAPTTLAGDLSDSGTSFDIADPTNYQTGTVGYFELVINKGGATEEKILCSQRVGQQITVAPGGRGYDGTLPQTHSTGETVQVCWTGVAADADNLHNASTAGVHGVAGNVVGDTDAQTLKNKTIDGTLNTLVNIPQSAITSLQSALIAVCDTGSGTGSNNYTFTSTTMAALDPTNASVQFTMPASGKVLLRASAWVSGSSVLAWYGWVTHGTSTLVSRKNALFIDFPNGTACSASSAQIFTGTPGTVYHLDLAFQDSSSTASLNIQNATGEVWAI